MMYNYNMILIKEKERDYELLDSGNGERLERFSDIIVCRPDPEVLWEKGNVDLWKNPDLKFIKTEKGFKWVFNKAEKSLENWKISLSKINLFLKTGAFKNLGVFPEQASNWDFMVNKISDRVNKEKEVRVLNLFGYTGGSSISLAKAGAVVTHIDSSKQAIMWANQNVQLNFKNKEEPRIRFLLDDAKKFVEKEIRRGSVYEAILMDPPVYGKSGKKDVWLLEKDLNDLILKSSKLLSKNPLFFVISGYASKYSHIAYANVLKNIFGSKYKIESGEFSIKESNRDILLPAGIFARVIFD